MYKNNKRYEEEITLKEIILTLVKEKKIIMATTSFFTILSIVISFFILQPIYESSTSFVMTIPESVQTKVGTYNYITTSYSDYLPLLKDQRVLNMTIESLDLDIDPTNLGKRIEYTLPDSRDGLKRGIILKVSGANKEENTLIANKHIKNYIEFLNIDFKKKAIDQFVRDYDVALELVERNIEVTEKKLRDSEALIGEVDKVITLQKTLSSNPEVAAKYAENKGVNVKDLTTDMLYDEVISPNYLSLESSILSYKKSLFDFEIEKERLTDLLKELENEKKALEYYYSTGDKSNLREDYVEVFNSKIQVMSPAVSPLGPISPQKSMNIIIGLILGIIIGIFASIFKGYWNRD